MSSSFDYLDLCRLCLVKDRVTVPIFEAEGDVRQIFLKITACLPVKVSRDDKLPKKICDDCVYKVETFYQFWNTTANAEKQLLQWLCEVGGLEDKQGYEVLDSNVMKQEQGTDSRLDGNVMQVGGHQNNMDMGMMDNMSLITMSTGSEQQFTSVPMDASGTVQAVPGPSTQTHEVAQSQTGVSHIVEEEEESEEDENSDEGCDNEEGLPVKEETEEGQSDQTLEPTQFVSLPCDEAGPSGLQQQKMAEMSEMTMQQTADGDPKTGSKRRRVIDEEGNYYQAIVPTTSIIPRATSTEFNDEDCFEEVGIDGSSSDKHTTAPAHSDEDSASTVFMCKPCKIYFPLLHMLEKHVNTMHPKRTASGRWYKTSMIENLQEQAGGYHKIDKQYSCNYCPYVSAQKSYMVAHVLRNHDKPNDKPNDKLNDKPIDKPKKTITIALKSSSMTVAVVSGNETKEKQNIEPEVYVEPEIQPAESEVVVEPADTTIEPEPPTESEFSFVSVMVDDEVVDANVVDFDVDTTEEVVVSSEAPEQFTTNETNTEVVTEIEDEAGRKYVCPYCDYSTRTRSIIHKHVNREHAKEWAQTVDKRLGRHYEDRSGLKDLIHPCYFCEFIAPTRTILGSHSRREHPGKVQPRRRRTNDYDIQCDQCDFKTTDRRKIQMHIERKHTTELRFACEYCHKKFKVKCDLMSHVKFQHFKRPCQCDVCGKVCGNPNSLHVHQKREHYKPKFECHICKRRMVSQENLDEHIYRQHEQRVGFMCEQCGKVFDQPSKLRQHSMTHTGERPHSCHICGKAFARRAVFRQHLLTHTGQRPYVCDLCGKSFTQKPGLICHRKSHPGEKPPLPVVYIDSILEKYVQKKGDEKEGEENDPWG